MDVNEGLFAYNPFSYALEILSLYGWWITAGLIAAVCAVNKLQPHYYKWQQQREDAAYHKDPDVNMDRMRAIQIAREKQQQEFEEAARIYEEKEKEREEKKRQQYIERNERPGSNSGNKLGYKDEYMPLCGAGTSGGYRPPKKSKCGGGGCGK